MESWRSVFEMRWFFACSDAFLPCDAIFVRGVQLVMSALRRRVTQGYAVIGRDGVK